MPSRKLPDRWITQPNSDHGVPGYVHWTEEECEIRDRIQEKELRDKLVNLGLRVQAKNPTDLSDGEIEELRQDFAHRLGFELQFRTMPPHFHEDPVRVRQLLRSLDMIEEIKALRISLKHADDCVTKLGGYGLC